MLSGWIKTSIQAARPPKNSSRPCQQPGQGWNSMQTFPKGPRAFPLFSTHPFLPRTMPGTAGKGSTYGLHSVRDLCEERTPRGCGLVKDPLTAGACNRSRVVSLHNTGQCAAPVSALSPCWLLHFRGTPINAVDSPRYSTGK